MIRSVLGSRASIGGVLGSGRGGAAAWYLAGGVSAANCVAAYTPKGAASLAASYDNNAAPGNGLADGTYDAAPGTAPTFDTATGWTFNGTTQWLATGVVPTSVYSIIVRISDATTMTGPGGSVPIGAQAAGSTRLYIRNSMFTTQHTFGYGSGGLNSAPSYLSGVLANCAGNGYYNGNLIDAASTSWSGTSVQLYIGAHNSSGTASLFFPGKIQAVAIYSDALSAAQVAAISAAMAAL